MSTHFLCTLTEPPEGFEVKVPSKSDLLRGTLVLLVKDETEGNRLLDGLWERFCGVLVIPGEETALEKPGPLAWKLRVEQRLLRHLRPLLEGFVAAIAMGKGALDQKVVWQKEIARLNLVHSAVREHYNLVTERLRHNVEQISDLNASLHEQLERVQKAEQALSSSERDLAITLDSIGDAVVATDLESRVRRMNPAAEELSGWKKDEAIGLPVERVFPLVDSCNRPLYPDPAERVMIQGRSVLGLGRDSLLRDRNGVEHSVVNSAAPILDHIGRQAGIVFVFRDVTEEKRVEQMKEDLVGMLTHDMRNPILAINKSLELLSTERLGTINENQNKIMKLAINTNDQLGSMVSSFLDIFRDVNGRFDLNRNFYDINQVFTQCIEEVSMLAEDKRLEISFQPQLRAMDLYCDLFRIKRTIGNLLSNAINYSVTDGKIYMATCIARGNDHEFRSLIPSGLRGRIAGNREYFWGTIKDTGYGIPEKYHEAVFEKFFTVKTDEGLGRRGIGLGLAFSKLVVEAHEGLIFCRTPKGADLNNRTPGVEFHIILPYGEHSP
jgi:PAS domain S-box-containing protein